MGRRAVASSWVLLLSALAVPAPALQYLGTTDFACSYFEAAGTGPAILDRDNTGAGAEAFRIEVTDGVGTLLYSEDFTNALGTYGNGLILITFYYTLPAFNPLRLTATSLSGNGLPAKVGYTATGLCAGLPATPAIPTLASPGRLAFAACLATLGGLFLRRRRWATPRHPAVKRLENPVAAVQQVARAPGARSGRDRGPHLSRRWCTGSGRRAPGDRSSG